MSRSMIALARADDECRLVAGQAHVLGLGAVAVEHRGDLAERAELARGALAELVADFGTDAVVSALGDFLLVRGLSHW